MSAVGVKELNISLSCGEDELAASSFLILLTSELLCVISRLKPLGGREQVEEKEEERQLKCLESLVTEHAFSSCW